MYVAKKNWKAMDRSFLRNFLLSAGTYLTGVTFMLLLTGFIAGKLPIIDGVISRFLPIIPVLFIAAGWLLQILVNSITVYLRAHKQEPLLYLSVATAAFISVTTLFAAKFLPPDYFFFGFTASYIWVLPTAILIFRRKKHLWHLSS